MGTHVTIGSLGNDTTGAQDRQNWGWMISPMPLSAPSPTGLGHSLAHTMPWRGAGHVSRFGDSGTRWARGTDGCHVVKGSGWGGCADTPRSPIQKHPLIVSRRIFWWRMETTVVGDLYIPPGSQAASTGWMAAIAFHLPVICTQKGVCSKRHWAEPGTSITTVSVRGALGATPVCSACGIRSLKWLSPSCGIRSLWDTSCSMLSEAGGSVGTSRLGNLPSP